jgi:Fic family protein
MAAKETCYVYRRPPIDLTRGWAGLSAATAAVARFDSAAVGLPAALKGVTFRDLLFRMEASSSSAIEGVEASARQLLMDEVLVGTDELASRDDQVREAARSLAAMHAAADLPARRPITPSFLFGIHAHLMEGAAGAHPGKFRKPPYVGYAAGRPAVDSQLVPKCVDDLLGFMAEDPGSEGPLVRVALAHALFELIHPFHDGNGRIGRLLMPLHLMRAGATTEPNLVLSGQLYVHREDYRQLLANLHKRGTSEDWVAWVEFMLEIMKEQALEHAAFFRLIRQRFDVVSKATLEAAGQRAAGHLLPKLLATPAFTVPSLRSDENRVTVHKWLEKLVAAKVIKVERPGVRRRATIYVCPALMRLLGRK